MRRVQHITGNILRVMSGITVYAAFDVWVNKPDDEFATVGKVVWVGQALI